MVNRKPYRLWLYRILCMTAGCVAWLLPAGLLMAGSVWQFQDTPHPLMASAGGGGIVISSLPEQTIPNLLSKKDAELYRAIFAAQKNADWKDADVSIAQLSNHMLLGHVLASRYLDRHYQTSSDELVNWLGHYADHPQAAEMYALAVAQSPDLKDLLPAIRRQPLLEGCGDNNGLAHADEDMPAIRTWHAGLAAWRYGHKQEAAKLFSAMTRSEDISPWMASAAAYWSYRAYDALGNHAEANRYLHLAAEQPRSFYGILARRQLKEPLGLDSAPVDLADSDLLEMIGDTGVRRTLALAQAGQDELAEKELRALFPQADDDEKPRLLALARELNLASVQIGMASQLGNEEGHGLDYARYPIPNWRPQEGFTVDPSLIFALMRQESGFRASAVSPGGALGLMQLMPGTARLMQKNMSSFSGSVIEPGLNMTLGQGYVQKLLDNELVDGNLIYLLAAYNAGPGKLQDWKQSIGHGDPLLFVESIPYAQTRNYVMQVMANYWIYSELAGKPSRSVYSLSHGNWPSYDGSALPVAARSGSDPAG